MANQLCEKPEGVETYNYKLLLEILILTPIICFKFSNNNSKQEMLSGTCQYYPQMECSPECYAIKDNYCELLNKNS